MGREERGDLVLLDDDGDPERLDTYGDVAHDDCDPGSDADTTNGRLGAAPRNGAQRRGRRQRAPRGRWRPQGGAGRGGRGGLAATRLVSPMAATARESRSFAWIV